MENVVACDICTHEFNENLVIPKMLDCGHSFCLSCIEKLAELHPKCPKCRIKMNKNKAINEYPTNYSLLEALNLNKSLIDILDSPTEHLLNKIDAKKEELSKKILQASNDLDQIKLDLEKLHDLTNSQNEIKDFNNAAMVLKFLESKYRKSISITRSEFLTANDPRYIKLGDYENSTKYLHEIGKKILNEEKIYAVKRIEDEIRYGKVSFENNIILFQALSKTKIPVSSSIIWFDELKKCDTTGNFFTFLKLDINGSGLIVMLTVKMINSQYASQFIRLCTGEYGPTYKGCLYEKYVAYIGNCTQIFQLKNYKQNNSLVNGPIDYISLERKESIKENAVCISGNSDGSFIVSQAYRDCEQDNIIGLVESPRDIKPSLFPNDSLEHKIVDCGICFQVI